MLTARGSIWGPSPLPDFLESQLRRHGFAPTDAGRCARLLSDARHSGAATASLFVDLGSCKFFEGDIDGAVAAWRHGLSGPHDAAAARSLLNLALLYEHLRLTERALALFDACISRNIDPYVVPATMAAARCRLAEGDGERAMEDMARLAQRLMADRPDSPELIATLFGLGEVALKADRHDRAERSWRVAMASPASPVQRAATERLLGLLIDQGRAVEALDLACGVASTGPVGVDGGVRADVLLGLVEACDGTAALPPLQELLRQIDHRSLGSGERFRLAELRRRVGLVNEAIDVLEFELGRDAPATQSRAAFQLGLIYREFSMAKAVTAMADRVRGSMDPYWIERAAELDDRGTKPQPEPEPAAAVPEPVPAPPDLELEPVVVALDDSVLDDDTGLTEPVVVILDDALAEGAEVADADTPDADTADSDRSGAADGGAAGADERDVEWDDKPIDDTDLDAATADDAETQRDGGVAADLDAAAEPAARRNGTRASAFADLLDDAPDPADSNPYAALAPSGESAASLPANPYAELAPELVDAEFTPPEGVRPGDWEAVLEDWPPVRDDADRARPKRPSAFSQYT